MNIKRIVFWGSFVVVLGLIIWGLIVAMNKPLPVATLGTPAEVTLADHIRGLTSASSSVPVTLIEYADFQCPACGAYYPWVERLVTEASTTARFVYRHFPLPQHLNAQLAARASEAASKQGKFWDMYRLIFDHQLEWSELPDPKARAMFEGYATDLGLDMVAFKLDLDSDETKARVARDLEEGRSLGIGGTPTFFINGKMITSPSTYDQFKTLIETASLGDTK